VVHEAVGEEVRRSAFILRHALVVAGHAGILVYFADGPNADFFAPAIENVGALVIPSISVYEVFKRVLQQRGEDTALQAVTVMTQGRIVDLDVPLALDAAKISADLRLPMADSIILATVRVYQATLWTQDEHFERVAGVKYIEKRPTSKAV